MAVVTLYKLGACLQDRVDAYGLVNGKTPIPGRSKKVRSRPSRCRHVVLAGNAISISRIRLFRRRQRRSYGCWTVIENESQRVQSTFSA